MDYSEFFKDERNKDFTNPGNIWMLAYYLDITDFNKYLNEVIEDLDTLEGVEVIEYWYHGEIYYLFTEVEASVIVKAYQEELADGMLQKIPFAVWKYFDSEKYSNDMFSSIYDIFDNVDELEIELDNVILPKVYVVHAN